MSPARRMGSSDVPRIPVQFLIDILPVAVFEPQNIEERVDYASCAIPFAPMSPHTLGPNFYSYVHLRKPRLAHTVTRDFGRIFFCFLASVRTNFGHFWAGWSQSELLSQLPQFRV